MVYAKKKKILLVANTSWYIYNFKLALIKRLIIEGYDIIIAAPIDKYTIRLKEEGIKFIPWELDRLSVNPIKELITLVNLISIYRKCSPYLSHHFTIKCCLYGSISSKFISGSKTINHITGIGPSFFSNRKLVKILNYLIRPIYRFVLKSNNSKVIFHNGHDKKLFIDLNLCRNEDSIIINGSGVDTSYFVPLIKKKEFSKPLQILFPARVIKEKGFYDLIDALKELWEDGFSLKLNVAGEIEKGNRSSLSSKQVKRIKELHKDIIFHGKSENIRDLYCKADIVILPSWREGLSLSLLEASSMSLPIITTDVPGCKDLIKHQISGLIVPPRNSIKITEAIKFLILNEEIAHSYGKKAREYVKEHYSIDKVSKDIIKVYKELINQV